MLTEGMLNGHSVLWLENRYLKIGVLPGKGADICEIHYKPSGIQFLMETPAGLRPPGQNPPSDFLENYEGGWQILFPNGNDACIVKGVEIPFHGEAALLPWEYELHPSGDECMAVRLWASCTRTPFLLERMMLLDNSRAALEIRDSVTNTSGEPWPLVWGQHLVLGGNFLKAGCRLEMPAKTLYTPAQLFEPATARLAPAQEGSWPHAKSRRPDEWIDLQEVPGPQIHSHDDLFVTGFKQGTLTVTNPRLELSFQMDWDADIFPWLILWQPFGGADLPPLTGIYGLGIEPWVSRYNLAQAISEDQAIYLGPNQTLATAMQVTIKDWSGSG
jgi:galactose mutarotase-like enzyme